MSLCMSLAQTPTTPGTWMHCTSHSSSVTRAWKPHTLLPLNLRLDTGRPAVTLPFEGTTVELHDSRGVEPARNVETVSDQAVRAEVKGRKRGCQKLEEERPAATSGTIMEVHRRNSCRENITSTAGSITKCSSLIEYHTIMFKYKKSKKKTQ